jgi:hypothetical protein
MGSSQSSYQRSLIDVLNENITNVVIKTGATSTSYCKSNQNIKIGEIDTNCTLNIAQSSQTVCDLRQVFSADNTAKMTSLINTALDNTATSKQKSVQDFMATSVSSQKNVSDISSYVKNIVKNNFTNETLSSCIAESTVDQNFYIEKIKTRCDNDNNKGINIDQNILLKQFADCTTKSVVDILKNDKIVTDIVNKAENDQSSDQKGATSLLSALVMPLIIIVVGLVVLAVVFKMLKGTISDAKSLSEDYKKQSQGQ